MPRSLLGTALLLAAALDARAQDSMPRVVARLDAPEWEERDRAASEIVERAKEWTDQDLALLAAATTADDPDLRDRAAALHRRVLVRRRLSDALLARDLDAGIDPSRPESFDPAIEGALAAWRLGRLGAEDLEGLVDLALEAGYRFPFPTVREPPEKAPLPANYARLYLARLDGEARERMEALALLEYAEGRTWVGDVAPYLADPDPIVRLYAAERLGERGASEHAPAIARLLADPDLRVRKEASTALGLLGARDRSGELVALLADDAPEVRQAAGAALRNLRAVDRVAEIAALLEDPRPSARCGAILALSFLDHQETAPRIADLLDDPDARVRLAACSSLERMDFPFDAVTIARLEREIGARVVGHLAYARRDEATDILCSLLADPSFPLAEQVVRAIGERPGARPVPILASALGHEKAEVRLAAARALLRCAEPAPIEAVTRAAGDPDPRVRRAIGRLLARSRSDAELEASLEDKDSGIREAAAIEVFARQRVPLVPAAVAILEAAGSDIAEALLAADPVPEDQRPALRELLTRDSLLLKAWACGQLALVGTHEDVPAVASLLADPDPRARAAAIGALGYLGAVEHRAAVEAALDDPAPEVRRAAVSASPRLGSLAGLLWALENPADDPWGGISTIFGLGEVGAIEPLERLVRSFESPRGYGAPVSALAALEDTAFAPRLLALCEAGEPSEVASAIRAVGDLGGPAEAESIRPRLDAGLVEIRSAAVDATLAIGGADAWIRLLPLLGERDAELREILMPGLARWSSRDALPELRRRLDDPDPLVRLASAELLWWIDGRDASPVVAELLDAGDPRTRAAAIATAGRIGATALRERIAEALTSHDQVEEETAIVALGRLARPIGRCVPIEKGDRLELEALGRIGDRRLADRAARSLEDWNLRHLAATVLGRLAALEHAPRLADALPVLDRDALAALADMGALEEVPAIARRLERPNERLEAVRSLHRLGNPLAQDGAEGLLGSPFVRERLEGALLFAEIAALRPESRRPGLAALAEDPSHLVRRAAAIARIALGELDLDAQLALVGEIQSFPNFSMRERWGRRLADALAARHEPDLFRRYALEAAVTGRVETPGDLAAVFEARGLALDASGRLVVVERTHPGSWTSPRRLLDRCLAPGKPSLTAWIEAGTARLVTVDDALDAWRTRLTR